jgi:hypothetical protein
LDNEASTAFKNFFTTNDMEYQLVPPHCHIHNAAERATHTFEENFVAGLVSVDPYFSIIFVGQTVPTSRNELRSASNIQTTSTIIRCSSFALNGGLQQNSFSPARMQDHSA